MSKMTREMQSPTLKKGGSCSQKVHNESDSLVNPYEGSDQGQKSGKGLISVISSPSLFLIECFCGFFA